jgi:hypothetical protein
MRNLLSAAHHRQRAMTAALVRAVFAQPDGDTARAQLRAVVDQLTPYAPTIAERLEAMKAEPTSSASSGQGARSRHRYARRPSGWTALQQ